MQIRAPLLALGLCLILPWGTSGCGRDQPEPETVIRPVRYQQVFLGETSRTRTFSGTARAGLETQLSFKVAGTVDRIAVDVGDRVRAGQLLASLDDTDYELQVEQTAAAYERAQAELRNAGANYDRIRALYENNNASRADLDQARTQRESAEAQARSMENSLELARLQLGYTRLRAPVDGAISACPVEVNENVAAGRTIVVLSAGDEPEVEIGVPEVLISKITQGMPAKVRFDALAGRELDATVTTVGVRPSEGSSTFPVTARLERGDAQVRPGMAAEVGFDFASGDGADRVVVPTVAVAEDRDGRFVYVVELAGEGLGTVRRRTVEVGDVMSDGLEIVGGLADGDLVVTAGVSKIQDGLTVRLQAR